MKKFVMHSDWLKFFMDLSFLRSKDSKGNDEFILKNLKHLLFVIDNYVNDVPLKVDKSMYIAEAVFISIKPQIDADLKAFKKSRGAMIAEALKENERENRFNS